MKRIRPAPMGRAFRYQRRLCHIIVTVAEKGKVLEPVAAKAAAPVKVAGKPPAKKTAGSTAAKKTAAKKADTKKPGKAKA